MDEERFTTDQQGTIFSRDEATLYERVSDGWMVVRSVGPSVRNPFFSAY